MTLNSFGETIRRIEAERKSEARAAIDAGWTEADHPAKCCPHLLESRPLTKREGRSLEELERLRDKAGGKAKWWTDAAARKQAELDARESARPQFDHGMLQLSLKTRQRGSSADMRMWRDLEHAKERAAHFTRLANKYTEQIEKRTK